MFEEKVAYILIRYSVLSNKPGGWVIGRDVDFSTYRDTLFDQARLDYHHHIFSNMTAPSINGAIGNSTLPTKCIVVTSEHLPDNHKRLLAHEAEKYDWLAVHEIGTDIHYEAAFEQAIQADLPGDDAICATIRLDDDDALSADFLQSVSTYMAPSYCGFALSLSKGYRGHFKQGILSSVSEIIYPKSAQGLCHIDRVSKGSKTLKTIYSIGNHNRIDEKVPLISDARRHAFIWGIHEASDQSHKNKNRTGKVLEKPLTEAIIAKFALGGAILNKA